MSDRLGKLWIRIQITLTHTWRPLYFIQRLRDEAHRFAIGAHRAKRVKQIGASPLDGISGIGSKRKKALFSHFGSGKAVKRASLADLKVVDGISNAMAEKIYNFFNEKS